MKPPKYPISILLRFISHDRFLFRFADRGEASNPPSDLLDRVRNCMIYLICTRPIISINPHSLQKHGGQYEFDIKYILDGLEEICHVKTPEGLIREHEGRVVVSSFPHTSILSYDEEDNLKTKMLISNFVHLLEGVPSAISNHEVLYVGKGTADCAVDRLDGHTTLEKILSDVLRDEPNKEVVILLYNFEVKKSAVTNTKLAKIAEIKGPRSSNHFSKVQKYKPGIDEQTKITEALLIDYFSTSKYNTHFANGLSLNSKIFENIRKVDIDAIAVEVDNENIGFLNIFSREVTPNYFHHARLDIRKLEGRLSVFENS